MDFDAAIQKIVTERDKKIADAHAEAARLMKALEEIRVMYARKNPHEKKGRPVGSYDKEGKRADARNWIRVHPTGEFTNRDWALAGHKASLLSKFIKDGLIIRTIRGTVSNPSHFKRRDGDVMTIAASA